MINIRCARSKWQFTQRECSSAILFLTALENASKDETIGRILTKDLIDEMIKLQPETKRKPEDMELVDFLSASLIWQIAYCGFVNITKGSYKRGTFSTMYYIYHLPKSEKYGLKTIKEDVQNYIKFKEEMEK